LNNDYLFAGDPLAVLLELAEPTVLLELDKLESKLRSLIAKNCGVFGKEASEIFHSKSLQDEHDFTWM